MIAIRGRFDGRVFIPDQPVDVPRDRPLILHVEVPPEPPQNGQPNLWDTLDHLTGTIDAPPDWSAEHDHYLYGTPKRHPKAGK